MQFGMLIQYLFEKFPNWQEIASHAIVDLQGNTFNAMTQLFVTWLCTYKTCKQEICCHTYHFHDAKLTSKFCCRTLKNLFSIK